MVDSTDLRAVSYQLSGTPQPLIWEASSAVTGLLELRGHRTSLSAAYGPRFSLRDFLGSPRYEVLHIGSVALSWFGQRTTLTLREDTSFGTNNFASLALPASPAQPSSSSGATGTTTPGGQGTTPPTASAGAVSQPVTGDVSRPIQYASSNTQLGLTSSLSRRTTVAAGCGFAVGGGLDDPSRRVLAFVQTTSGNLGLIESLTSQDQFFSDLGVTHSQVSMSQLLPAQTYLQLTASQGMRHRWTRTSESRGLVGLSGVFGTFESSPPRRTARSFPVMELSHTLRFGQRLDRYEVTVRAGYSPLLSRLTGTIDGRAQLSSALVWQHGPARLQLLAGAGSSVPTDQAGGTTFLSAGLEGQYRLGRLVGLHAALSTTWQNVRSVDAYPGGQSAVNTASLGVDLSSPSFRF